MRRIGGGVIAGAVAVLGSCGLVRDGERGKPVRPDASVPLSIDASVSEDAGVRREAGSSPEPDSGPHDAGRTARGDEGPHRKSDGSVDRDATLGGFTVHGRIINVRGQPVPGWPVAILNQVTKTDGEGRFVVDGVLSPYDVAFVSPGKPAAYVNPQLWIYSGLTRSDPTLQTDFILDDREAYALLNTVNTPVPARVDGGKRIVQMSAAFGFAETSTNSSEITDRIVGRDLHWMGPEIIDGTIHLLSWIQAERPTDGLSFEYVAYRERPLQLRDGERPSITLDQSPTTVPASRYSARVVTRWAPDERAGRGVSGMIAFDSSARILVPIFGVQSVDEQVELLVPSLPGSRIFLYASQGGGYGTESMPTGSVCRPADSTSETFLQVPEPRSLLEPPYGTKNVDAATAFTWTSGPHVSTFTVACPFASITVNRVGVQDSTHFPTAAALGMSLPTDAECSWSVAVHGEHLSTDDATGPRGMLTTCDDGTNAALLPEGGSVTRSDWRWFHTAQ